MLKKKEAKFYLEQALIEYQQLVGPFHQNTIAVKDFLNQIFGFGLVNIAKPSGSWKKNSENVNSLISKDLLQAESLPVGCAGRSRTVEGQGHAQGPEPDQQERLCRRADIPRGRDREQAG